MTVTLDYTNLHFDDDREVLSATELEFEHELLFAELVFRIDAADFSFEEYTPLLDAAAILRGRVNLLADGESSRYESPVSGETLTFARSGDEVAVSANYTDAQATVGLAELKAATVTFHQRVTRDVLARYPGLAENPAAAKYLALDGQCSSLGA